MNLPAGLKNLPSLLLCALLTAGASHEALAGDIYKFNNTTNLDVAASWSNSILPTSTDWAVYSTNLTSANTASIGGGLSVGGIKFVGNPGGNITISTGTGSLTNGALGIDVSTSSNRTLTIAAPMVLSADQIWTTGTLGTASAPASQIIVTGIISGSGKLTINGPAGAPYSPVFLGALNTFSGGLELNSGGAIRLYGTGTPTFSGGLPTASSIGTGNLTINGGTIFGNAGTIGPQLITVNNDFNVNYGASGGINGRLTIGGGTMDLTGVTRTVSLGRFTNAVAALTGGGESFRFLLSANAPAILITNGTLRFVRGSEGTASDYAVVVFSTSTSFAAGTGLTIGTNVITSLANDNPFGTTQATLPYLTVESGGYFNMSTTANIRSSQIRTLSGAGYVTSMAPNLGTSTLTINSQSGDTATFSGQIVDGSSLRSTLVSNALGAVALTKTGAGTQILSGNNSYSGATTISAGALQVGHGSALGNPGQGYAFRLSNNATSAGANITTVSSGAVLDLNGQSVVNERFNVSGTGISSAGAVINSSSSAASIGGSAVNTVTISNTGSWTTGTLSAAPTVTVTGGGGSGLTANALVGITTLSLTSAGTGYASTPTVTVTGGGGTGAVITATVSGGAITALTLVNPGTGYTSMPTISFSSGSASASVTALGVTGLEITSFGTGYTSAPTITIDSTGWATGATAGATVASFDLASASSIGGTGDISIALPVTGAFALTKVGGNRLTLSSSNTYSGGTTLSAGTLGIGNSFALGTGALTNSGNNTLQAAVADLNITNNVALSSGALTIDTQNNSMTNSGVISSSGVLAKAGAGTLTLNGTNTYTGATAINAGVLSIGGSGQLNSGTYSGLITNNGILEYASSANQTLSGIVSGTGDLNKSSSGTLTLAATNTYSGATTVNDGTLLLSNSSALQNSLLRLTNAGGNVLFQTITSATIGGLQGNGNLAMTNLAGASVALTLSNPASTASTYTGNLTGGSTLTKTGAGTQILSGNNNYSGTTTVSGGTLSIASSGAYSTNGATTVNAGATLNITNSGVAINTGLSGTFLTVNGTVNISNNASWSNTNAANNVIVVSGGTLNIGTNGTVALTNGGRGYVQISNGGTISVASGGTLGTSLYVSAVGSAGSGTNLLTNAGTLNTIGFYVGSGATGLNLLANSGTWTNTGNAIVIGQSTTSTGTNTVVNAGTFNNSKDIIVGGAAATSGQNIFENAGTMTNSAVINIGNAAATGVTNIFRNSGTLDNSGVISIGNSASFSGLNTFEMTGGTINATTNINVGNTASAQSTNRLLLTGGTLNSTAYLYIGNAGSAYNVFSNNGGTIIFTGANSGIQLGSGSSSNLNELILDNGVISGAMSVGRTGSNETNRVTVNGGIMTNSSLGLGVGFSTAAGSNNFNNFIVNGGSVVGGTITMGVVASNNTYGSNTNTLQLNGGVLTANSIVAGAASSTKGDTNSIIFNGGTLQAGSSAGANFLANGVASVTLSAGGGTIDSSNKAITIGAVIDGDGALTKAGTGTLTLTNANTYSGATTIQVGALILGGSGALSSSTTVAVSNSATFDLGGRNQEIAGLTGAGNVTNTSGNTLTVNKASGNNAFSGAIQGAGNLAKSGNGTLTLSGNSTYTGTTAVTAGALIIDGDNSAANGTVTVVSGATLGGSGTIGGATTIQSGAVLAPGSSPGLLTFASNLTLEGEVVMELNGLGRGTTYDAINVGGQLAYGGKLTLNFGNTFSLNDSFNLFDFTSTSGSFDSIDITGSYGTGSLVNSSGTWTGNVGGQDFQFLQSAGTLDVVPEPSTYALIALAAAGFGAHILRRRKR